MESSTMSASFNGNLAVKKHDANARTYSYRDLFKENVKLSNREREIASLIADGLSNKEIASDLFIAEKTVKFHNTNIFKKVGVVSRAQLIVAVMQYRANEPMIVAKHVSGAV